jgi:hypothetical protein
MRGSGRRSRASAPAAAKVSLHPPILSPAGLPAHPSSIPVEGERSHPPQAKKTPNQNEAPPIVHEALRSAGQPLDATTRTSMERSFGRDFRDVRVHTDDAASDSARAVDAQAFTAGHHIVFDRGRYAPDTVSGRRLLIHEIAHVVQRGRVPGQGESWLLGDPSSAAEHTADAAVVALEQMPSVHPAVLDSGLASTATHEPVLRRAVSTWGGEWDTSTFNAVEPDPTDPTLHGADIDLKFTPKDPADATEIGIVQTELSKDNAGPIVIGGSATLAARTVPPGQTGAGRRIDQLEAFGNPLYATGASRPADKLWDTATGPQFGHHGYHHVDSKGVLAHREALLKDKPRLLKTRVNPSQVFEDTAIAVTGVQTGATYGSVQWGWKTDAAGNAVKIPLTKVSDDTPSVGFKQAEALWNKSKDSAGNDLIKFFTASRMFVQADDTPLVSDPADPAKTELARLPKNARIEVINKGVWEPFNAGAASIKWWNITVTDGADVGKTGWVQSNQLGNAKVAEATGGTP